MPIDRGGYSNYLYGSGDFGTSGFTYDGIAAVSATATVSCSGGRSLKSSAALASASTITASAMRERESGATVSLTSSVAAAGEGVVIKRTDKLAYGGGVYGYNVFDNADLQTISSATASGSTANGERIHLASGSLAASCTTSASCERVREAETSPTLEGGVLIGIAAATVSATGAFTVYAQPQTITPRATATSTIERVRFTTQIVTAESAVVAIGREKWEIITNDSNIWTTIAA